MRFTASRLCSTCGRDYDFSALTEGWTADEHGLFRCPACTEGCKPITRQEFRDYLHRLHERIDQITMSTQADADALVAQVNQVQADLKTARDALQAEIDSLSANQSGVDLTGLQTALAPLDDAVKSLGTLKPDVAGSDVPISSGPANASQSTINGPSSQAPTADQVGSAPVDPAPVDEPSPESSDEHGTSEVAGADPSQPGA